jgi:hypothetical protein
VWAIHGVASRLTQAAYEGWRKDALASIAPKPPSMAAGEPEEYPAATMTAIRTFLDAQHVEVEL